MKLYIIIAPRRSGHHAILNWINSILPGKGLTIEDTDWVYNKPMFIPKKENKELIYLDHDLQHKKKPLDNISYILYNIEERPLNLIIENLTNPQVGWDEIILLLNLRSFLNFISSKVYHPIEGNEKNVENGKNIWLEYSKEILKETNLLNNFPFTPILFDKWFKNYDYRKHLCNILKGDIKNENINQVSDNGHGSTFDKMGNDGDAQQSKVLERYKKLPEYYIEEYNSSIFKSYSDKIFN